MKRILQLLAVGFPLLCSANITMAKEIRDWFVWCKGDLECTMQTDNADDGIYGFGFVRGPKANAEPVVFLNIGFDLVQRSTITIILDDDKAKPFVLETTPASLDGSTWRFPNQGAGVELIQAVMAASSMRIIVETSEGEKEIALSVSGATGSALYLDEAQMRIGNLDALKATGGNPAKDAYSRVTLLKGVQDLPNAVRLGWQANNGECSDDYGDGDLIKRFGGEKIEGKEGASLFILPCGGPGAYNLPSAAYFYDVNEDRAMRAFFPTMAKDGPTVADNAYNISWDHVEETLTAFYKGRGIGDCGIASTWQWDGYSYSQLVLVKEIAKDECDGKYDDWPQVWPIVR